VRAVLIIARKDLAQRLRDRTFFIIGLAAPLILAFIFNLILGSVIGQDASPTFDFGLVDLDSGPVSDGFEQMLNGMEQEGVIVLTRYESEDAAQVAVDDGDVDAVFVLPANLSTAMVAGQATVNVLGNIDSPVGRAVADAVAQEFARRLHTASIAVQAALATNAIGPADIASATAAAAQAALPLAMETIEVRSRQVDAATFFIAGMGIFFVFFIVGQSVTSMLEERNNGTLARLLAAPVRPAAIIAGKTLTSIVLGVIAMAVLAVASTLLMGAEWGNVFAAGAIIVAYVIAAAGLMTFAGGLARTAEQANNLQAIVAMTLAMLGGTFVPITSDAGLLNTIRYLTPNAWYIQGLGDIAGGAYAEALLATGVLLAIGIVFGAIGLPLMRRALRP
jgi:ABC-2 type transport system permease protein